MSASDRSPGDGLELVVARLLTVGTYASVACLAVGVGLLLAAGRSPLEGGPPLDSGRLVADIVGLRPEGFLWLGLIVAIATPSARVAASLLGYLRSGERAMALVSTLILAVIAVSVIASAVEG